MDSLKKERDAEKLTLQNLNNIVVVDDESS